MCVWGGCRRFLNRWSSFTVVYFKSDLKSRKYLSCFSISRNFGINLHIAKTHSKITVEGKRDSFIYLNFNPIKPLGMNCQDLTYSCVFTASVFSSKKYLQKILTAILCSLSTQATLRVSDLLMETRPNRRGTTTNKIWWEDYFTCWENRIFR